MNDYGKLIGDARVEFRRSLPASPEKVWAYLVEDRHRRTWLCGGDVEPRVGGKVELDFDHSRFTDDPPPDVEGCGPVRLEGEVLIYERPHRLSFTWPSPEGMPATVVTISLTETEAGVELHLVHERIDNAEHRSGAAAGWHAHLEVLAARLADGPTPAFWKRYQALHEHYSRATL